MESRSIPNSLLIVGILALGAATCAHAAPSLKPPLNPTIKPLKPLVIGLPPVPAKPIFFNGFTDGNLCVAPLPTAAADLDVHRSLLVHDDATLNALGAKFTLRRVLERLADDANQSISNTNSLSTASLTPEDLFRQFWDTQNDFPNAVTPNNNPHCDDGDGKINGYPLNTCPRADGQEAWGPNAILGQRIDEYAPLALVNRLDLAGQNWQNCGEHRIIFGRNGSGKRLIIFEAVLPNPKPGCRSACKPVVEFWADLSSDTDPISRASKLENFYFNGLPGFSPVVKSSHYSSGSSSVYGGSNSGQIRTDQISSDPWTLKEFKTLLTCGNGQCDFDIMPTSVKGNPYGPLWNRDVAMGIVGTAPTPDNPYDDTAPINNLAALSAHFQNAVLNQVMPSRLANPDINGFSYAVSAPFNAAESQSQAPTIDHYPAQFSSASDPAFHIALDNAGSAFGLSGAQLVNRATALSCAGCHQPNAFGLTNSNAIGPGQSWPPSLGFVHVQTVMSDISSEVGFDPLVFSNNPQGFELSPALLGTFLPARQQILADLASQDVCNCIPNFIIRPFPPIGGETLARIKVIDGELSRELKSDLKQINNQVRQSRMGLEEKIGLVEKGNALIHSAESRLLSSLARVGIFQSPIPPEQQAIQLGSRTKPTAELKRRVMDRMAAKEISRKTFKGSFRVH